MSRPAGSIIGKNLDANTSNTSGIWTVPQALDKLAAGNWPASAVWPEPTVLQIDRSLRFNSLDSAYLNRTATSGSRTTFTFSAWLKRGALGSFTTFFSGVDTSTVMDYLSFDADGKALISSFNGVDYIVRTKGLLRDPSSWYHIVIAFDSTQATSTNRVKIYVNGVDQTDTTGTFPSLNYATQINNNGKTQYVGYNQYNYWDGYMTEVNFVDGQQLAATDFGLFDSDTGVWQPKAYTGSYGTNGFYLNFSDNTSTTTIGEDQAGSNDWTTNNVSVTAGVTNDSLLDTPSRYGTDTGVGGEVGGNYATLNPLRLYIGTPINGNLEINASNGGAYGSFAVTTGKWYWETVYTSISTDEGSIIGIRSYEAINGASEDAIGYFGGGSVSGSKIVAGSVSAYGAGWTTNDVMGIALDLDGGSITFYKNNSSQGAISFTPGGKSWTSFNWRTGTPSGNNTFSMNFGQRPFTYTAPSGFKALCTTNLPTPTIEDGSQYFDAKLWAGNGSTQTITGYEFAPDFAWIKSRSDGQGHVLYDQVRPLGNYITSNGTDAEASAFSMFTAWTSDGFSLATTGGNNTNGSGRNYVGWAWKANGAGVSNTDGNITSTVSANTDSGFSIVTYTGTGTSGRTVGHGLGVTPAMIMVKSRSASGSWIVWHKNLTGIGYNLYLQATDSQQNDGQFTGAINSTTFGIHVNGGSTNVNNVTYVAYCFAAVPGYSAFGSYTGNGSADGPFVYTGFSTAFVLIKRTDAGEPWNIYDNRRLGYNPASKGLYPNDSAAENDASGRYKDLLSNGFKIRGNSGEQNASGGTYVYMAFAENPFNYALAR